jgi:hypothetical protein
MRVILLAGLLLGAPQDIPKPAPRVATGSWAGLLKEHPRLFGSKAGLASRAKEKPELWRDVQATKELLPAGLKHAVEGIPKSEIDGHLAPVMKDVARGPTNVHQDTWIALDRAALAFDLFHDAIPAKDRQAVIDWMNAHLGTFTEDEGAFHNSTLSKILAYLRVAYATWGENPKA